VGRAIGLTGEQNGVSAETHGDLIAAPSSGSSHDIKPGTDLALLSEVYYLGAVLLNGARQSNLRRRLKVGMTGSSFCANHFLTYFGCSAN